LACVLAVALPAIAGADFATRFEGIKREASPEELYSLLYALPKGGDLHNHFGGSGRSEWWLEAALDPAVNEGVSFHTRVRFLDCPESPLPFVRFQTWRSSVVAGLPECVQGEWEPLHSLSPELRNEWLSSLRLDRPGQGRSEFFDLVWTRLGHLRTHLGINLAVMRRNLAAFGAEGVRYVEWQWGARGFVGPGDQLVPTEEAVARVRTLLAEPTVRATGVTVRFQEAFLRFHPHAERHLRDGYAFVAGHRDLWVGLNMVGLEERGGGHPRRFLELFRELRRSTPGIPLALHAGEMDGPNAHVRDALLLGASRIGHGLNLIHDEDTLLLLRASGRFLVEINLISNRLLEYTPDLRLHPFPEYLRTGIPVCLNTDDRGMWDSNLTDEYYTAVTFYDLSWPELVQLGRDSLRFAFVEATEKQRLLERYETDLAAFVARLDRDDWRASLATVRPVAYGYARRTWGFTFPEE
jgi:adenosine deaminase CECR1